MEIVEDLIACLFFCSGCQNASLGAFWCTLGALRCKYFAFSPDGTAGDIDTLVLLETFTSFAVCF